MIKRWKFLKKGMKYASGDQKWALNKWVKVDGELDMCNRGLHACKEPYEAFSYVQGEILAQVECKGEHLLDDNKECWREQRVIKTYRWTKKDSLRLAIFSSELCLKNYEKEYPEDKRPRDAIEAAKKVLFKDTAKNRSAAESAAWSAGSAAESAAWSAARSAGLAARSAAWSAAWSAGSAAVKKIQKYFMVIVKEKMK